MDRNRRGGGGVAWSGDACVALAACDQVNTRLFNVGAGQDEGDASVPTPHHPDPRPYGYEGACEAT
ncbi:MAG: hypothetical protein E6I91_06915 [Chloroflexi bacterium]|nr:MAG: hypothetical protein E6I91_06915 [Chloroflexota bacterium]